MCVVDKRSLCVEELSVLAFPVAASIGAFRCYVGGSRPMFERSR